MYANRFLFADTSQRTHIKLKLNPYVYAQYIFRNSIRINVMKLFYTSTKGTSTNDMIRDGVDHEIVAVCDS